MHPGRDLEAALRRGRRLHAGAVRLLAGIQRQSLVVSPPEAPRGSGGRRGIACVYELHDCDDEEEQGEDDMRLEERGVDEGQSEHDSKGEEVRPA